MFEVTYTYTDEFTALFSDGSEQILIAYWYDDVDERLIGARALEFFHHPSICGDPKVKLISTEIKRV